MYETVLPFRIELVLSQTSVYTPGSSAGILPDTAATWLSRVLIGSSTVSLSDSSDGWRVQGTGNGISQRIPLAHAAAGLSI